MSATHHGMLQIMTEYADIIDLNRLGALVVKGIRREAWDGNPPPRMVEVPGGLINAIGLQGPGVAGFIEQYMPFLRQFDVPVIVNIWGTDCVMNPSAVQVAPWQCRLPRSQMLMGPNVRAPVDISDPFSEER